MVDNSQTTFCSAFSETKMFDFLSFIQVSSYSTGSICSNSSLVRTCAWRRIGLISHVEIIKWKYFPRYWPFVRGIHRSPVDSLHKGQWRGALMFSLILAWTNSSTVEQNTVECRYNAVQYCKILHKWLQEQRHNINQVMDPQKIAHTSP